jgi:hypothetical protein
MEDTMDEFTDITPGKWQVMSGKEYYEIFGISGPVPRYCIVSFEDGNTEPWTVAEIVGGLDPGQEDANARLIAAAPLMYEALQDLIEVAKMEDWQYATTGRQMLLKNAQAALSAAGGNND